MKILMLLIKSLFNKDVYFDVLCDLRTICVAILVVGGASRFFGIHNQHYVIIAAFIVWLGCNILTNYLRKKIK